MACGDGCGSWAGGSVDARSPGQVAALWNAACRSGRNAGLSSSAAARGSACGLGSGDARLASGADGGSASRVINVAVCLEEAKLYFTSSAVLSITKADSSPVSLGDLLGEHKPDAGAARLGRVEGDK